MSVSETLETIALFEKLAPFEHAQGPNVVWKEFDPSPRKFTDLGMDIEYNHPIPTRDGIKLRGDIYLPLARPEDSKLPVVLVYTPFGKQKAFDVTKIPPSRDFDAGFDGVHFSKYAPFEGSDPYFWTKQGFAYVAVDTRGSYASEGAFYTMVSKLDGLDAYDTIEYLGARAWSNGRVEMIGASGLGAVQW
ncbi:Alpha/Beta hydrolase protein [Aspergillus unguis]